jgi:hypothetical protein
MLSAPPSKQKLPKGYFIIHLFTQNIHIFYKKMFDKIRENFCGTLCEYVTITVFNPIPFRRNGGGLKLVIYDNLQKNVDEYILTKPYFGSILNT